jgi:putative ABC transport system ATP-binding protein/lipoprotein-releasing system ATP-binding protein
MRDVLVQGKEVTRRFRQGDVDVYALRPTSFVVRAGDRIALVGRSGSGKSTLLHLIADLDQPTGGKLAWPALGVHGALRPKHIGMVFQAPSLIPTLSAVENVELPLRLAGTDGSPRQAAMQALEAVGLLSVADKLPDELSGGQAQRVALARAIASQPRLVIADEPTGQLDHPTARQAIDTLLASVAGTQTALVVATHDPLVAERMDVTWLMEHGQLHAPETSPAP